MKKILVLIFLLSFPLRSRADFVVVVSKQNDYVLKQADVRKLYLGQITTFPNGKRAVPLMLIEGAPERPIFLQKTLLITESRYISIWAKLLFTGNGTPPIELKDNNEMAAFLLQNPLAVGYLPRSEIDERFRVVAEFDSISGND